MDLRRRAWGVRVTWPWTRYLAARRLKAKRRAAALKGAATRRAKREAEDREWYAMTAELVRRKNEYRATLGLPPLPRGWGRYP